MYFIDPKLENYLFWIAKLAMLNYSLYRFNVLLIQRHLKSVEGFINILNCYWLQAFTNTFSVSDCYEQAMLKIWKKAGPSL